MNKEEKVVPEMEKKLEPKAKDKTPVKPKAIKPKAIKPYTHIDTFLLTAKVLYNVSSIEAQGFKVKMDGGHYQQDETVFLRELKKYLNIK